LGLIQAWWRQPRAVGSTLNIKQIEQALRALPAARVVEIGAIDEAIEIVENSAMMFDAADRYHQGIKAGARAFENLLSPTVPPGDQEGETG